MKTQFEIGTSFVHRDTRTYIIDDIHVVTSIKTGEIVKHVYICYTMYLGQRLYNYDMPASTIARALLKG